MIGYVGHFFQCLLGRLYDVGPILRKGEDPQREPVPSMRRSVARAEHERGPQITLDATIFPLTRMLSGS